MSLFDGKPMEIPVESSKVVLSASRMTDMPKYYPRELIEEVNQRLSKGMQIHTLVLWTKHPGSLFIDPLYEYLLELKQKNIQLYLQLTITGIGGLKVGIKSNGRPLILEPNAPLFQDSLNLLPQIVQLLELPERIKLRIDPIVRIMDSRGKVFSNLKFFPKIIRNAASYGVKHFVFSFLESGAHRKVDKRFRSMGCRIIPPNKEERERTLIWLRNLESKYNINIESCCVQDFPEGKCVDGRMLMNYHANRDPVDLSQPRKREKCGCTASIDIGGWPPKKCYTGCDYCYANSHYQY